MFTLESIYTMLGVGELSQFALSGDIDDEFAGITQQTDWNRLASHVQLGLTQLHTRFSLKEREVVIQQYDELSFYVLDSKYSIHNTEETTLPKYIRDSTDMPFSDDVLRIDAVYDEAGNPLAINDFTNPNSVYLANYRTIQIPRPSPDNAVFIVYLADHAKLPKNITEPSEVEIDIPAYLVQPLMTFVTARMYSSSSDPTKQQLSAAKMMQFEAECKELQDNNVLYNSPNDTNTKLDKGGWV